MTGKDILTNLWKSGMVDEIILNITKNNPLAEDLKSELFLILLEMPESKIQSAYNGKWLTYLVVNVIKKMWNSNTSPFYKKWRKQLPNWSADETPFPENLIGDIIKAVEVLPLVERELFMMRYKIGKYDRWLGDWRDMKCKKSISSFRSIENKLQIGGLKIDHSTVGVYHKKTITHLRNIFREDDNFNI